jgi:hypothetical protein
MLWSWAIHIGLVTDLSLFPFLTVSDPVPHRLSLQQLIQQINIIREKAAEAEAIVKNITSDIQRLDIAKRNLTGAITAVKRWNMMRECIFFSGRERKRTNGGALAQLTREIGQAFQTAPRFRI